MNNYGWLTSDLERDRKEILGPNTEGVVVKESPDSQFLFMFDVENLFETQLCLYD